MFGRAQARAVLQDVLAAAEESHARTLTLVGEPGLGKTMLCEDTLRQAAERGFLTVSAAGVEWESGFELAAMTQIIRPLARFVPTMRDRLAPPIQAIMDGSEEPFDDRFAVAAAVFRAVVTAAEYRPLLITVDDAQWLDNASVAVLIFIVRRLYADAIAIVLAHRAGEPEKFPADWPHLALTPLGTEDVCQMIAAQRPDLPPVHRNVGESITERSGGNPLVLSELMPYLTAAQCTGAASLPDPLPLGERGRLNFGRQIGALPDRTRTALALVAAAGSQPLLVPPALARLGREPADLDPAIEAGILTEPPQYQFSHPLRRSAAYLGVPAACRRNIHEVLAELNRGQDVERYAWHLDRAAAAPDVVADATELAAQDISTRAGPAAAGPSWARSAELTADPSTRRRRALQAASSYFQAGDVKACNRWLADAFAGPTSSGQLVHDETAAEALLLKCQVSVWHPVDRASIDALVADAERLAVDDPPRAVYALGMLAAAYENRGDLLGRPRGSWAGTSSSSPNAGPLIRSPSPAERERQPQSAS